jgi:hypothetical protein
MLEEALALASEGLWVFPIPVGEKRPGAVLHGHLDASTSPTLIHQWWTEDPEANIGIACRSSGLLSIDIDGVEGFASLARAEEGLGALPATLTVRSGGDGEHRSFLAPDEDLHGFLGSNSGRVKGSLQRDGYPKIDIKFNGYVVAPPSLHKSGKRYEWKLRIPPVELPEAWTSFIVRPKPQPAPPLPPRASDSQGMDPFERARRYLAKMEPAIQGSGGSTSTFNAALALARGFGLSEGETYSLLMSDYNPRCEPPWSERELEHKAHDAVNSGAVPLGYLLEKEPSRPARAATTSAPRDDEPPPPTDEDAPAAPPKSGGSNGTKPKAPAKVLDLEGLRVDKLWPAFSEELRIRATVGHKGVCTGLKKLDELLGGGGLPFGQTTELCGAPGLNKTSFALSIARHHAQEGGPAFVWSRELPRLLVFGRYVCQQTFAPWSKVLSGQCPEDVTKTGGMIAGLPLYVYDGVDPSLVTGWLEVHAEARPAPFVVVDYLQLLASTDARDQRQATEKASEWIVNLAKSSGAAVLAISATSRAAYSIGEGGKIEIDRVLQMGRDSGRLEFDAAAMLALVPIRKKGEDEAPGRFRRGYLVCAKNRLGMSGRVAVEIDGQAGLVRELTPEEISEDKGSKEKRDYAAEILQALERVSLEGGEFPGSATALALLVAGNRTRVRDALAELVRDGRVVRLGPTRCGYYATPEHAARKKIGSEKIGSHPTGVGIPDPISPVSPPNTPDRAWRSSESKNPGPDKDPGPQALGADMGDAGPSGPSDAGPYKQQDSTAKAHDE